MIIPMLEGVSEMLDGIDVIKVQCAKIMLDKIILGMKPRSSLFDEPVETSQVEVKIPEKPVRTRTPNNAPPITVNPPSQDQYPIVLNDDKTIKEIQGLPFDALVELDGVKMTHRDAIGMTFEQGRIL